MVEEAPSLNPALFDFWTAPARGRVLYGGRASSKSWDAAGWAIFLSTEYKIRVMCARQFQNKIAESVYTLLKIQIERFGLQAQFKITDNSIINMVTGSEFIFYGIARNIDEIKSAEGIDILWIEEAHALTKKQWDTLEPTIRADGSQIWVIMNPGLITDFSYQRFIVNPPEDFIVRKINYDENIFLSQTMLRVIANAKAASDRDGSGDYEHIYLGVPRDDDDSSVIKRSWIEAAIDAHYKLGFAAEGRKVIGYDVADSGQDKCANVFAHGSVAFWCEEWKAREDELLKSCSRTWGNARKYEAEIVYDSIGVGASAGAKFDELNQVGEGKISYRKFNSGGAVHEPEKYYAQDRMTKVKNKDFFSNIKAQAWWSLADRFRNTYDAVRNGTEYPVDELISISSEMPQLEKLKTELSTPKRDFDQNGRVKVESKKDLAKREIASPNLADAFVMCYAPRPFGGVKISADAILKSSAGTMR